MGNVNAERVGVSCFVWLDPFDLGRGITLAPEKQKTQMLSGCVGNKNVAEGKQENEDSPRAQRQISQKQKEENGCKKEGRADNMLCGAPILPLLAKMNFTRRIIFFERAREDSNDKGLPEFFDHCECRGLTRIRSATATGSERRSKWKCF